MTGSSYMPGGKSSLLKVPVVIIFFNRPCELQRVWDAVSLVKPEIVVAISDGARTSEDQALIDSCRSIIRPDWNCKVVKLYRDTNFGLRKNVIEGVSTVFDTFPQAIVLEDDCVPHPSFFYYCQELLELYESDERIFSITGMNQFANQLAPGKSGDYRFSRYFSSWGWASWRRAWQQANWQTFPKPEDFAGRLAAPVFPDTNTYWDNLLRQPHKYHQLDSWAFQACLTALQNSQLTIFPTVNMIDNIGLHSGVHFKNKLMSWKMPEAKDLIFPIKHPEVVAADTRYDGLFERRHFDPNRLRKALRKLKEHFLPR